MNLNQETVNNKIYKYTQKLQQSNSRSDTDLYQRKLQEYQSMTGGNKSFSVAEWYDRVKKRALTYKQEIDAKQEVAKQEIDAKQEASRKQAAEQAVEARETGTNFLESGKETIEKEFETLKEQIAELKSRIDKLEKNQK